jgi:hypothetical protein
VSAASNLLAALADVAVNPPAPVALQSQIQLRAALAEVISLPTADPKPQSAVSVPALSPTHLPKVPASRPVSARRVQSAADDALPPEPPPRPLRVMLDELARHDPDRMPWPDDWLTRREVPDVRACLALWGEALRRMLLSACDTVVRHHMEPSGVGSGWVGSRDFHEVCALAGLNGVAIEEKVRPLLQSAESAKALRDRLAAPRERGPGEESDD